MRTISRHLSILLSLILVFGMLTLMPASSASADTTYETYAMDNVQGGAVLHCFNWSYNNIKAALPDIAKAGYTAVQTSPVQRPKEYNASYTESGNWYKLYQPLGFSIAADGTTWYGTKAELTSLCNEADKYGIKVIVDVVANHLANNGTDGGTYSYLHKDVESDLKNANYYHTNNIKTNESNRYNITQYHLGMPDLNTANSHVQQRVLGLLKECIDCGVDGFRFDAAKHIEVPADSSNFASNFWPNVLDGATDYAEGKGVEKPFYYGEILKSAGPNNFPISNYTQYMAVTDNETGDRALEGAYLNDAETLANDNYVKGASAEDSILWVESHDTYMGNSGSAASLSNTKSVTKGTINRAWAIVGARADSTSLFFARPSNTMGAASTDTNWKSNVVTEVNKFKNHFAGTNEHLAYSDGYNAAYIERGTAGVVISRENSGTVSLTTYQMADGCYKDQLTGNTFKVANGTITGTVGSTGVAVVYGEGDPSAEIESPDPTTPTKNTYTVYAVNNASWNNVNIYWWGSSTTVSWPGVEMTSVSGKKVYSYELPKDATGVVLNSGSSQQTVDITSGFKNGAVWTIESTTTDGKYNISSAPDYYMVGNMNNWTNEDEYKFSINPSASGKLEYKLSGVQLSANAELKIHSNADTWFPSGNGGNYKVNQAGTYDIYFRPEGDGDNSWYQSLFVLEAVPQEVSITYNYNVYDEATKQPVGKSVSKTVGVGDYTYAQLVELNKPYIKSPYYEYGEATFTRSGSAITATIPNTDKKYSVALNGVEKGEYKYMDSAEVGTGEQKSFIVDGKVVYVGAFYSFYVCGDTDITTGNPTDKAEYAFIDLNNVSVTDEKVELDMLATANVGTSTYQRMGVAFALSDREEKDIKAAVQNVTTGTAVDKNKGIAVHNSSVNMYNKSGQYQFRYAPYFARDKAQDAKLYFYTFVVTDEGITVSDAASYDMRNIMA